jgi:hypothetical protein
VLYLLPAITMTFWIPPTTISLENTWKRGSYYMTWLKRTQPYSVLQTRGQRFEDWKSMDVLLSTFAKVMMSGRVQMCRSPSRSL